MRKILLLILLNIGLWAQVAPAYQPYSLEHPQIEFSSHELANLDDDISIDFIKEAHLTIQPEGLIYRMSISFEDIKSGYIQITNWEVPKGSLLFIFNDKQSYTGPYLSEYDISFTSGRFTSHRLILEYFEPFNAEFSGNFNIKGIISDFIIPSIQKPNIVNISSKSNRERPKIMVTGYWPPTNEMVRHFSQNIELNPSGWEGENWEGMGYDIVSFFPEFNPADCNSCGQGYGDLEVDYQDFSEDFWPIVEEVQPVAIITFSRGFNDMSWELENRVVNRTNWYDDYTAPYLPTPNPPDDTVNNYHVRYTSLPVTEIINAIQEADISLDPYLDNTNAGMYLSEFAGYHGVWYKETFELDIDKPCYASGHIHVGSQIDWDTAKEAAEISIRTLINYVDQFMVIAGDCNTDGDINILDIVALSGAILGDIEFTELQNTTADIDGNGLLNILDIIAIINIILLD